MDIIRIVQTRRHNLPNGEWEEWTVDAATSEGEDVNAAFAELRRVIEAELRASEGRWEEETPHE